MSQGVSSISDSFSSLKGSFLSVGRIRENITAAKREKEILETNYAKRPLTHRNIENLVEAQRIFDACNPNQSAPEVQISDWLELISTVCSLLPPLEYRGIGTTD